MSQSQKQPGKFVWRKEEASSSTSVEDEISSQEVDEEEHEQQQESVKVVAPKIGTREAQSPKYLQWSSGVVAKAHEEEEDKHTFAPKRAEQTLVQPQNTAAKSNVVVGIVCHNAENTVGRTIAQLLSLGAEILVCDDGSTDLSEEIARKMGTRIIKHPRSLGRSDSLASLFLEARRLQAEVLITISADLEFKLSDVITLIDALEKGECDIAVGSRLLEEDNTEEDIATSFDIPQIKDTESILRAYNKKALALIAPPQIRAVIVESKILEFADQQNLRVKEYPVSLASDGVAVTKKKKQSALTRLMSFAAVKHPLVFFGLPGLGFFAAAAYQSWLTLMVVLTTRVIPDFGITLAVLLLLVSAVLAAGSGVLFSQKVNRPQD